MNVTEIRKLVRESEEKQKLRDFEIHINYPLANFKIDLKGLDSIYQFFNKEVEFYKDVRSVPSPLNNSLNYFKECISQIENVVQNNLRHRRGGLDQDLSNLRNFLTRQQHGSYHVFNRDSSTTNFLVELNQNYPNSSIGAYDFLAAQPFQHNQQNQAYFIGWQRAYEFVMQDNEIVKRRKNERKTLSQIRAEYLKNLEQNDSNVSEHIANKEVEYKKKEEGISRLIRLKNSHVERLRSDQQKHFEDFMTASHKSINDLEGLYQEKLKLEAPAKYWKDRAVALHKDGWVWLKWLIGCSGVGVILLAGVLGLFSAGKLADFFKETGSAIKWSIVFVTFVSFLAFIIRVFSKLVFSAFHLKRDAEEREQLAYVYLALRKEKNIDDTERHLVMQSIFSRADSGLLKEDASPTMPGNIIDKVIGKGS